jgi:hypothetical protein
MMMKYPGQFISIRYEDLATAPVETFSKVCAFLGLEFNQSSLDFYKKELEIKKSINAEIFNQYQTSLFNPIDASRINTWNGRINETTLKMADAIVGGIADHYGYERTFKNVGLKIYLRIIPRILYLRSYYFYKFVLNRLPQGLRRKLKSIVPKLGVLYYKLFPSDLIKES